jgi:hypothetical protein
MELLQSISQTIAQYFGAGSLDLPHEAEDVVLSLAIVAHVLERLANGFRDGHKKMHELVSINQSTKTQKSNSRLTG